MEPFVIYIFKKGQVLYGAAKYKDELTDEVYGYGFRLEKDHKKQKKDNTPNRIKLRAKKSIVNRISNSLNTILLYGHDCVDEKGEIEWEKFRQEELVKACDMLKESPKFEEKDETEDQKADRIIETFDKDRKEFNSKYKIHTFKVQEISLTEAKNYKII